jgi:HEPN domain-containing protein
MKAATRDWVKKAEGDYLAALDLSRRRKLPLHDMVCFHCQQSAEKYLKARLEEAGIPSPKTHDLERLLNLVLPAEPLWSAMLTIVQHLTGYAVDFRYPGHEATKQQAKTALAECRSVRREARTALGLTT